MATEDIQERLALLEGRVMELERILRSDATSTKTTKVQSLREFINLKQPNTANDKGLVIAYYLELIRKEGAFNIDDLRQGFMEAKLPAPQNINDMVNKNIAKGFMMASSSKSGKRSWVLTNSGENVVEKGFGE